MFDLTKLGGKIIAQKDAFLCAAKGVRIGIEFQKGFGTGIFGGEGFIIENWKVMDWPLLTLVDT